MNAKANQSKYAGGCSCRAIEYEITGEPETSVVCHCSDCRRAVGAQSVAYIFVRTDQYRILKGKPKVHRSSPGVRRSFCGDCGTTLSWEGETQPGRIDITTGSLDEPNRFAPSRAVYRKHRIPWASEI